MRDTNMSQDLALDGIIDYEEPGEEFNPEESVIEAEGTPVTSPSEVEREAQEARERAKQGVEASGPRVLGWFDASERDIREQFQQLRPFVDWVCEVYRFEANEALGCWWRHPGIAAEWLGLWHLYRLSFSVEDSGAGPNTFNYMLAAFRIRLHGHTGKLQCKATQHVEPRPPICDVTTATDEEWERVAGVRTYEPSPRWPRFAGSAGGSGEA
ncbi:hypothetical protein DAD186_14240 [Dermabacter vaginalis]|uniref:DUF4913 domain-containing protein n=1 Tax=Dermabacter vaginalis TaxID=1630135 RepID=A0A1B0ZJ05_9MICO|nr:hypothetical protein [Dermabacter vaginalis]ANP27974.1 hypothetical protein DAD186_14240 [Dermabacter vaginalis]